MARIKSPEKRSAILQAAVREIAEVGLGAPTAKIASRAGLATGTLFTYFANKEKLLNEHYLELKIEVYRRVNTNFPGKANLERRARHVWSSSLDWAIEFPEKRKVSVRLNVSDLITPETRMREAAERGMIEVTLRESVEGRQEGDPCKIADLIVRLANHDELPLRLILGVEAEKWVQQAEARRASEAEKWRHLTISTVFEKAESIPEPLSH